MNGNDRRLTGVVRRLVSLTSWTLWCQIVAFFIENMYNPIESILISFSVILINQTRNLTYRSEEMKSIFNTLYQHVRSRDTKTKNYS